MSENLKKFTNTCALLGQIDHQIHLLEIEKEKVVKQLDYLIVEIQKDNEQAKKA